MQSSVCRDPATPEAQAAGIDEMMAPAMSVIRRCGGGEDWWQFRRAHPRIYIGRTGEDGSQSDWQSLLRDVGASALHHAVMNTNPPQNGTKVYMADVLATIAEVEKPKAAVKATGYALKHRQDEAIWCLCHNPKAYADWCGGDKPITEEKKENYIKFAESIRRQLCHTVGIDYEKLSLPGWKTALYEAALKKRIREWLADKRAIPTEAP